MGDHIEALRQLIAERDSLNSRNLPDGPWQAKHAQDSMTYVPRCAAFILEHGDAVLEALKATHPQPVTPAVKLNGAEIVGAPGDPVKVNGKVATHYCKLCGALWHMTGIYWHLVSTTADECCDNVEMGGQIAPLALPVTPAGGEVEPRGWLNEEGSYLSTAQRDRMIASGASAGASIGEVTFGKIAQKHDIPLYTHPPVADAALSLDDGMRFLDWFLKELRKTADYDPSDTSVGIMSDCWHASSDELAAALGVAIAALNKRGGG